MPSDNRIGTDVPSQVQDVAGNDEVTLVRKFGKETYVAS
jgi:hypothetical protein